MFIVCQKYTLMFGYHLTNLMADDVEQLVNCGGRMFNAEELQNLIDDNENFSKHGSQESPDSPDGSIVFLPDANPSQLVNPDTVQIHSWDLTLSDLEQMAPKEIKVLLGSLGLSTNGDKIRLIGIYLR